MWRNKQHLPEGGKGTVVRINHHKSLYQLWVRLFSRVSLPRRRPFSGDAGLLHLLLLEVDVLLLGVRGQDGGGLADLHPGVECCDLWLLLIMLRAPDNAAPDVLIASGQLQLLKLVANINRPPDKLSKAVVEINDNCPFYLSQRSVLAGTCQGFLFGNVRTSSAQLAGCHAPSYRGTRVQAQSNARRNLRRTIASQAELGAERQNSRCYSSMTGSLQKTTFFQTSFANCFLRSALCPPRPDWHLPGEIVSAAENIY